MPRRQPNSHDATGGVTLRARRPPLASATTSEYALTGAPSAGGMLHVSMRLFVPKLALLTSSCGVGGFTPRHGGEGAGGGEGAVSALAGRFAVAFGSATGGASSAASAPQEAVTIGLDGPRQPAAPSGWIHST